MYSKAENRVSSRGGEYIPIVHSRIDVTLPMQLLFQAARNTSRAASGSLAMTDR